MPSSATTRLRLEKQAAGENNNTWGQPKLNTVIDLVDQAIAGRSAVTVSGSVTLTATNFAADQARSIFLDCSGTGGTITIPAVEKLYLLRNASSGSIIITCGGTTNATIQAGNSSWVACDATNVYTVSAPDHGGARVQHIGTPTATDDATTKAYVDAGDAAQKAYTDATAFSSAGGTLPAQTSNARKVIKTDGSAASWQWPLTPWAKKTANYTALSNDRIAADTSGGSFTVTLPASPVDGDEVVISDDGNSSTNQGWATHNLTVSRNGNTIMGLAQDLTCNVRGASFRLLYEAATTDWRVKTL